MSTVEKQHLIEALSYQIGRCVNESVRQQAVNLLVNVDKQMATIVADNVGVQRPDGDNVPVSTVYPSLSILNTRYTAYTQRVGVLIGDGFNDEEVTGVLNALKQNGVFIQIISEKLGTVTGVNGMNLAVDHTFLTSSPYLLDSLYIAGGHTRNRSKFYEDMMYYFNVAYKNFKPIGIAALNDFHFRVSRDNNMAGVIFAENNPDFSKQFLEAIATQRFWNRT